MSTLNPYSGPWDSRKASFLLGRTTFGKTKAQIDEQLRDLKKPSIFSSVQFRRLHLRFITNLKTIPKLRLEALGLENINQTIASWDSGMPEGDLLSFGKQVSCKNLVCLYLKKWFCFGMSTFLSTISIWEKSVFNIYLLLEAMHLVISEHWLKK